MYKGRNRSKAKKVAKITRLGNDQASVWWSGHSHLISRKPLKAPQNCPFLLLTSSPPKVYANRPGLRTEQTCLYTLAFAHDKNQALPPTNSLGDSKTAMFSKNLQEAILSTFHKRVLLQDACLACSSPSQDLCPAPADCHCVRRLAHSRLLGDQIRETTVKPQQPSSVFI